MNTTGEPLPVTLMVVAKAPVPGQAKTRLAASVGATAAAELAAAALLDTLDAVLATPVRTHVVALTGDLARARRGSEIDSLLHGFTVIEQRGGDFSERLACAHADAGRRWAQPVLQIGMDTPQVTGKMLSRCARELLDLRTVLGLARDGGWWILGVADGRHAGCLRRVPMSQHDTGRRTLQALNAAGLSVTLLPELDDFDTITDLPAVYEACPAGSRLRAAATAYGISR